MNHKYAGFWIRVLAMLIDCVILSIIGWLAFGSDVATVTDGTLNINFNGWKTLFPVVYTLGFWLWLSSTPGKLALGLKIIVKETGAKIGLKQAIIRYIGYILSAIPFFIGFFWIAGSKEKQGWHDKLAGTLVVHKN